MKNLIYQVWAGEMRPGCKYSEKLFREYAQKIGADYRLDIDPNIASKYVKGKNGMYFEWLNPMLDDSFLEYDKVCVIDLDVFPVENLTANIFDEPIKDFGICTEPFQGKYRESTTIGKNPSKSGYAFVYLSTFLNHMFEYSSSNSNILTHSFVAFVIPKFTCVLKSVSLLFSIKLTVNPL